MSPSHGFVSINILVSLDERYAVNLGQFQTRGDFQAIFRNPRVLLKLSEAPRRRIILGTRMHHYDLIAATSQGGE